MAGARLTSLARSLPATVPFVGPESQERVRGRAFAARLGANELGFGPAPSVIDAISRAAGDVWMYGDPENYDVITALATHHGIPAHSIMVAEGIDSLLGYLVRLLIGPGDPVVTSDGAYPTFNYHVTGFGGVIHTVPYHDDRENPQALLDKAREVGAKLIYLCNPDNPMGTWLKAAEINQMIADLPEGTLLLLDEAYVEFAPRDAAPALNTDDPRVIRMRTFSKAHGLAGMRIGYALGHADLISAFHKVRNHFGMNRLSQIAAYASLADQAHLARTIKNVSDARERITRIAEQNSLRAIPSATNFVTIDCGRDGDYARAILSNLIERGAFIRMPFVFPADRCIRISCGPVEELDFVEEVLPLALGSV